MARITVEDCLAREGNRFALVQLAAKRAKQLLNGAKAHITDNRGNKCIVVALREIAAGEVRFMTDEEMAESAAHSNESADHAHTSHAHTSQVSHAHASEIGSSGLSETNGDQGRQDHREKATPAFADDDEE